MDCITRLIETEQMSTILHYDIVEQGEVGYALWSRERGDLPFTPSTGERSSSTGIERVKPIPILEVGASRPLVVVYSDVGMLP